MVEAPITKRCPACDSLLSRQGVGTGLCPACLLELALEAPSLMAEIEDPGDDGTLVFAREAFSPGQVLGQRYRIRALLGRGGMGEVWRASDLKLRVDVALKALRPQLVEDERALATLRQEVRAAREVVSPNVCRVFDLVEIEGQELVSMEYIDGRTLLDILKTRAPLELATAREIASQFLAGLEAIHGAGLVHRDVKPENIMRTRSGRVVLTDFGIAKGLAEGQASTVAGTPAYMAPEQSRGEALDARADVFSAGVVLAEMLAPEGLASPEVRRNLWEGIHREPPEIADTPWTAVLGKAVARQKERRFPTASALARALEEVTLRAAGDEDLHPYPGLASFTQEDAEYFFGRELEVEEMWKKLARPHLLALIGPSGAGKSSFLRAGLLSVLPSGWGALVTTPGERPFTALSEGLVSELAGDAEAMKELLRFEEPDLAVSVVSRWRRRHEEALLIVDQFEELFTQNPPAVQERFSELLARLALEADVHVLLAMRDDFLFHCSGQPGLAPIFSELTPLKPLSGAALRRALVQPALKCGYRFEDDALVNEMVGEVEAERGALPLLAFAAARLWALRDREQGLLTREANEHIGGVAGALAQHAEATLETIGHDRIPLVRELFRNLVTSEGTRATRRREELLSVFSEEDRPAAERILASLVDARLLTSYEVAGEDKDTSEQRIEIIHESLLSNWPRLVRWQTQDADSAQLRDQIRQAARLWLDRGRSQDLLWTGTAFDEFQVWRERYPGGLSSAEEEFAKAMTDRAYRRRRRRRLAVAAALLAALGVAAVTGTLWRRSVAAEKATAAEARRAEASKLLALARLEEERYPTAALAYTTKSLELADTAPARRVALELLAQGPVARILPTARSPGMGHPYLGVSPDGEWLATSLPVTGEVHLFSRDGSPRKVLRLPAFEYYRTPDFGPRSDLLILHMYFDPIIHIWSVSAGEPIRNIRPGPAEPGENQVRSVAKLRGDRLITFSWAGPEYRCLVQSWSLAGGAPEPLGDCSQTENFRLDGAWDVDPSGTWIAYAKPADRIVYRRPLEGLDRAIPEVVGSHDDEIKTLGFSPAGDLLHLTDGSARAVIWSLESTTPEPLQIFGGVKTENQFPPGIDPTSSWLAWGSSADRAVYLRHLEEPPDARPLRLGRHDEDNVLNGVFDPRGEWLATRHYDTISFWSLDGSWSRRLEAPALLTSELVPSADGRRLASCHGGRHRLRLWPLVAGEVDDGRVALEPCFGVAAHPTLPQVLHAYGYGLVSLVSTEDGTVRTLAGGEIDGFPGGIAFDPEGRVAVVGMQEGGRPLRIWSLESGELRILATGDGAAERQRSIHDLAFSPDGSLFSAGQGGVLRWDLERGSNEVFYASEMARIDLSPDGNRLLATAGEGAGKWNLGATQLLLFDLVAGTNQKITTHGESVQNVAFDPTGRIIVTGDAEGVVRVGPVSGEEPHLLLGHEEHVKAVAFSPDGQWIYSGAGAEIRRWPMPDPAAPPLHTLPLRELLDELRSRTNLRVVEDPGSADGWKLEVGPFSG